MAVFVAEKAARGQPSMIITIIMPTARPKAKALQKGGGPFVGAGVPVTLPSPVARYVNRSNIFRGCPSLPKT
jgi:hypothetical protein